MNTFFFSFLPSDQLLFLFLSLIQISCQVSSMGQQGLIGYWTTPCSWVEVSLPRQNNHSSINVCKTLESRRTHQLSVRRTLIQTRSRQPHWKNKVTCGCLSNNPDKQNTQKYYLKVKLSMKHSERSFLPLSVFCRSVCPQRHLCTMCVTFITPLLSWALQSCWRETTTEAVWTFASWLPGNKWEKFTAPSLGK